jgi:hypothetical protein
MRCCLLRASRFPGASCCGDIKRIDEVGGNARPGCDLLEHARAISASMQACTVGAAYVAQRISGELLRARVQPENRLSARPRERMTRHQANL